MPSEMDDSDLEAVAQGLIAVARVFAEAVQPLVEAVTIVANMLAAWVRSWPPEVIEALLEASRQEPVPLTVNELRELCASAGTDGAAVRFDSEGGWCCMPSEN